MGDFSVFVSEAHIEAMRKYLEKRGYVDAGDLTRLFSVVRANDQIWSPAISHYLMGQEAAPSDLLYWFADGARIPERMQNDVSENFVYGNKLHEKGGMVLDGVALDLGIVETPVYLISLKDDHVAEWKGTYRGTQLFGGETHFLLGGSGHNAGTLSAPSMNRHGYWPTNGSRAPPSTKAPGGRRGKAGSRKPPAANRSLHALSAPAISSPLNPRPGHT